MARRNFGLDEARNIGDWLGIDWNKVDVEQFRKGLEIEMEHGTQWGDETNVTSDDLLLTGRIAWAHLKEIKDYYTRLEKMEAEAKSER